MQCDQACLGACNTWVFIPLILGQPVATQASNMGVRHGSWMQFEHVTVLHFDVTGVYQYWPYRVSSCLQGLLHASSAVVTSLIVDIVARTSYYVSRATQEAIFRGRATRATGFCTLGGTVAPMSEIIGHFTSSTLVK